MSVEMAGELFYLLFDLTLCFRLLFLNDDHTIGKSRAVNSPQRSRLFASPTLESLQSWKEQKCHECNLQKKVLAGDRSNVCVIPTVDSPWFLWTSGAGLV